MKSLLDYNKSLVLRVIDNVLHADYDNLPQFTGLGIDKNITENEGNRVLGCIMSLGSRIIAGKNVRLINCNIGEDVVLDIADGVTLVGCCFKGEGTGLNIKIGANSVVYATTFTGGGWHPCYESPRIQDMPTLTIGENAVICAGSFKLCAKCDISFGAGLFMYLCGAHMLQRDRYNVDLKDARTHIRVGKNCTMMQHSVYIGIGVDLIAGNNIELLDVVSMTAKRQRQYDSDIKEVENLDTTTGLLSYMGIAGGSYARSFSCITRLTSSRFVRVGNNCRISAPLDVHSSSLEIGDDVQIGLLGVYNADKDIHSWNKTGCSLPIKGRHIRLDKRSSVVLYSTMQSMAPNNYHVRGSRCKARISAGKNSTLHILDVIGFATYGTSVIVDDNEISYV